LKALEVLNEKNEVKARRERIKKIFFYKANKLKPNFEV